MRERKGNKLAKHSAFPMFSGSGKSDSRLAKKAGVKTNGQKVSKHL